MYFSSIGRRLNVDAIDSNIIHQSIQVIQSDIPNDSLEKGMVSDVLVDRLYTSAPYSGKDIKEALSKALEKLEKINSQCYKDMEKYEKLSGFKPSQPISRYRLKGLELQMDHIPNMYSSSDMNKCCIEKKVNWEDCPCRYYNEHAELYVDSCIDKIYCRTLIDQVQDNQTYHLSVKQAAALGITSNKA